MSVSAKYSTIGGTIWIMKFVPKEWVMALPFRVVKYPKLKNFN
jgi:hypothetical protein